MDADELLKGCSDPELFGPNSDPEKRKAFLRNAGLVVDPKIDAPEHYFHSLKDFRHSKKYYGYVEGHHDRIFYKS